MRNGACLVLASIALVVPAGCQGKAGDECTLDPYYSPVIDPADFVAAVDNPLMPLAPGSSFSYSGGGESVEVRVTTDTRVIMGVSCVVVRDTVSEEGDVVEDTLDWYAEDAAGNVWYMGEDSREMEGGEVVSTEGSWEAGMDGALPGYIMLASPTVGLIYRQEYYACEAEDMAEVVSLDESVSVPAGDFDGCVEVHEWSPLEEGSDELKYFCPGVGLALEIDPEGARVELVDYTIP